MSGLVLAGIAVGVVLVLGLVFVAAVTVSTWVTASIMRTVLLAAGAAGLLVLGVSERVAVLALVGLGLGFVVVGSWSFMTRR